jgi:hypothetical protein
MIAGSNPNNDVSTVKYATEYRVEWLSPAYLSQPRPTYTGLPATVDFGTTFMLQVTLLATATSVTGTAGFYERPQKKNTVTHSSPLGQSR